MKLVLIGFMASGKSSVAKALARSLTLPVIEVDELIIEKSKRSSIQEIFETLGESKFREIEASVISELGSVNAAIISPGGGSVLAPGNVRSLKKNGGRFIYLKTSFDKIAKRVENARAENAAERPLFKDAGNALKLFHERAPLYEQIADITVETDSKDIEEVARSVLEAVARELPKVCLIIGDPVSGSLSPTMHNAAYRELKLDREYVFVAKRIPAETLSDEIASLRAPQIAGASCTMPHKEAIISLLDELDETARSIGAVNTIINRSGKLLGLNTDWRGVTEPLLKATALVGKKVAVIGAGGAARAACYGLLREKSEVVLFNRSPEKAKKIASQIGCLFEPLEKLEPGFDIYVNATPIGMRDNAGQTPVPADFLSSKNIVFDMVYQPHETRLLREAKARGAVTIHGIEMLLYQGAAQFELYTGRKPPLEAMRRALAASLKIE